MKRTNLKRGIAVLASLFLAVSTCFSGSTGLLGIKSYADARAASVNATSLNVRSGPGTSYSAVARLSYGASVTVVGEQTGSDGVLWYQIQFSGSGGAQTTGYVSSQYIKFPTAIVNDGNFETYMNQQGFPESYKPGLRQLHSEFPNWTFTAFQTNLDWNTVIQNESVIGRNLVARSSISSWKSTAVGAYDWNTSTWPGFDGSSWVQASEDIIRYYMDPRNFLNDKYVYQFMKQSYNSTLHTREGLVGMVSGTFLSGNAPGFGAPAGSSGAPGNSSDNSAQVSPEAGPGMSGPGSTSPGSDSSKSQDQGGAAPISPLSPVASISSHQTDRVMTAYGPGMGQTTPESSFGGTDSSKSGTEAAATGSSSYTDIIMNASAQSGVNPYILASMILQEQGNQGNGRSISGTVPGYEGYYNYFNIESYQSGSLGAVERGLWWASQSGNYNRPWNSAEKAILGGAMWYGNNYVKQGQDTLYLKKFNVQGSNLYKHQYMTNVQAAASEGANLSKISALKNAPLEFSIPVYNNMPDTACAQPTGDGSPNNKLSALGVEGFAVTPTFTRDTESYDLIVDHSVTSVNVAASALDSAAVVSGTGTVNLQSGINEITVSVKAANGAVRNYVLHVLRQTNGPTYSGSIGSGVTSGGGGTGSGTGPGGGPGAGPGGQSSSNTGNSEGESNVEILGPPGTSAGGGGSGPIAPDGSGLNGFGKEEDGFDLKGPDGVTVPGGNSSNGTESKNLETGYQRVASGVTAQELCNRLQASYGDGLVKVYTSGGQEASGPVGTGNLLMIYSSGGDPLAKYEIVVKGDNTGDGRVNILDVLKAQRHVLGMEQITGAYQEASDINGNQKIDITDILAMQKDILGIQKLQ